MVASISSDGRYVITTNANRHAYLWDIKNQTQKQLRSYPVNIYSAYFVKGKHQYLIQNDRTNHVLVQNIDGNTIKTIKPDFAVYGEAIDSSLRYYAASEEKEKMHLFDLKTGKKGWYGNPNLGFFGGNKLWQPMFTPNQKYIVMTSGYGELDITDVVKRKPIVDIVKNNGFTASDISPDGHYVVTADENKMGIKYNLKKQKLLQTKSGYAHFFFRTPEAPIKSYLYRRKPYIHGNRNLHAADNIVGINFISPRQVMVAFRGIDATFDYLGLYNINKLRYIDMDDGSKAAAYFPHYLKLGTKTITVHKNGKTHKKTIYPETQSFLRSQSFDTAPQANRVVMGQANGGGIMVYQYDPDKQKLKLIWAPQLKEHEGHWWQFWK